MSTIDACAEALYLDGPMSLAPWDRLTEHDRQVLRDLAQVVLDVPTASDEEAAEAVYGYAFSAPVGGRSRPWGEAPDYRRYLPRRIVRIVRDAEASVMPQPSLFEGVAA